MPYRLVSGQWVAMHFTSETAKAAAAKSAKVRAKKPTVKCDHLYNFGRCQFCGVEDSVIRANRIKLRKKYVGEEYLLRRKIIAQQKIIFRLKNKLRVFQCMRRP